MPGTYLYIKGSMTLSPNVSRTSILPLETRGGRGGGGGQRYGDLPQICTTTARPMKRPGGSAKSPKLFTTLQGLEPLTLSDGRTAAVGLVVMASASRAADSSSIPVFAVGTFAIRVKPATSKLGLHWILLYQAPGDRRTALGLVGPVSLHCGRDGKFHPQLLPQCGSTDNRLSRSVPETH